MIRLWLVGLVLLVSACGPLPKARIPLSGQTAGDGGGEAALGNLPRGLTNFPYGRR